MPTVFTNPVTYYLYANYSVSRFFDRMASCRIATICISIVSESFNKAFKCVDYLDKIKITSLFCQIRTR